MPEDISDELVAELLGKPKAPQEPGKFTRLIRRRIDFPQFPKGSGITRHGTFPPNPALHCAARGCRTPTQYRFRGIPYCRYCLTIILAHELAYNPADLSGRLESELNATNADNPPNPT